ncbi:MAG: GDSL-type esterase/lipase family protein [Chitinophagaceae bacterium]
MKSILFWILSTCLFVSCAPKSVSKPAFYKGLQKEFSYSGRTEKLNDSIEALISSAAHVTFKAKSDSITVLIGAKGETHSYVVVEVNGNYYGRFKVQRDSVNRISLSLPKNKNNLVRLYKATEASNGAILFYGVESNHIAAAKIKANASIEFIGNSITCGFGADTKEIPCGTGEWYDQHNAYLAYGPLVARKLNAGYILSSVSGMGIYRNWNDEDTAPVMGDVYATANLNGDKTKPFNFSNNKMPDLVSICLGTNDLSNGDGKKPRKPFDAEKFTNKYIDFVNEIFTHYPNAKLALLTSPMISGANNQILLNCLKKVKAYFDGSYTVSIFEFKPMKPGGCGTHPDLNDHKAMADQLFPFYAELLK